MEQHEQTMSLISHLDELRKRLIIIVFAFLVSFIGAFIYIEELYNFIVMGLDFKLAVLSPTEIVVIYFKLAGIAALAPTIPVIAWQLWLFIKPGLMPHERKLTLTYIPALFLLFVSGLCFGYFFIFPIIFDFLLSLAGENMQNMFTIEKYFQFLIRVVLPIAILFELPVVVMFLTSIGIIDPQKLIKVRKYAYFGLVIISAVITPPDFFTQILVMIPLFILYEVSISMSRFVYRRKIRKESKLQSEP